MSHYPAFVDGEAGAYGVTFPDLPGIAAMGETVEDALANAEEALRDYVTEAERDDVRAAEASPVEQVLPPEGSVLVALPSSTHPENTEQSREERHSNADDWYRPSRYHINAERCA